MAGKNVPIMIIDQRTFRPRNIMVEDLNKFEHTEELVFSLLRNEGIVPVVYSMWGIKMIRTNLWLAPNEPISTMIEYLQAGPRSRKPQLMLRFRFRGVAIDLLKGFCPVSFALEFAHIRWTFTKTAYPRHIRKDYMMFTKPVLSLVAGDLARHCLENYENPNQMLQRERWSRFWPRSGLMLYAYFLKWFQSGENLARQIRTTMEINRNDPELLRSAYISFFCQEVCPEYYSETYDVVHVKTTDGTEQRDNMELRIILHTRQYSTECVLEMREQIVLPEFQKKVVRWHEQCDMRNVGSIKLEQDNKVTISGIGPTESFIFKSLLEAKSFISCLDGYHRLSRRYHSCLCPDVKSPQLAYLMEMGIHGPVGHSFAIDKLWFRGQIGAYMIRLSSYDHNEYLIDTLVGDLRSFPIEVMLSVKYDPVDKLYRHHEIKSKMVRSIWVVRTRRFEYVTLKKLIEDTELHFHFQCPDDSRRRLHKTYALKFFVQPNEDDVCKRIMHCLRFFDREDNDRFVTLVSQMPRLISPKFLKVIEDISSPLKNGMRAERGTFNDELKVIVKRRDRRQYRARPGLKDFTFHHCPNEHDPSKDRHVETSINRLYEFVYLRYVYFVHHLGYVMSGAFVANFHELGALNKYLKEKRVISVEKLQICQQLTAALLFLEEHMIIHGKIRCRNLVVAAARPIHVRLTDSLGALDTVKDKPFIPPEYYREKPTTCIKDFYTGIDVWATGTTIWQIWNKGRDPPQELYGSELPQADVPTYLWVLIEGCWLQAIDKRKQPYTLQQDVTDVAKWHIGNLVKGFNELYRNWKPGDPKPYGSPLPARSKASAAPPERARRTRVHPTATQPKLLAPGSPYTGPRPSTSTQPEPIPSTSTQPEPIPSTSTQLEPIPSTSTRIDLSPSAKPLVKPTIPRTPKLTKPKTIRLAYSEMTIDDGPQSSESGIASAATPSLCTVRGRITSRSQLRKTTAASSSLSTPSSSFEQSDKSNSARPMSPPGPFDDLKERGELTSVLHLKMGIEIGRGANGVVSKALMIRDIHLDGHVIHAETVVAVKTVEQDELIDELRAEFEIMKDLRHRNIVQTAGWLNGPDLKVVFEWVPLGCLLNIIRAANSLSALYKMPLPKYCHDICEGMDYLGFRGIVHRDLALRNVLLAKNDTVKICDFGMAQYYRKRYNPLDEKDKAFPLAWFAPEAMKTWKFTPATDVWAFGVLMWEMYSIGAMPQYPGRPDDLPKTLLTERLPMPAGCSMLMYDIMQGCWEYDPKRRRTFHSLINFFSSFRHRK